MHATENTQRFRLEDGLALAGCVAALAVLAANWHTTPARIAIHFGLHGEANGFGSRGWLFFPPLFGVALWLTMFFVRRLPRFYNLPASPGAPARVAQERVAAQMLAVLGVVFAWLSCFLECMEVANAHGQMSALTLWVTPVVLLATLTPVGWFLWRLNTMR